MNGSGRGRACFDDDGDMILVLEAAQFGERAQKGGDDGWLARQRLALPVRMHQIQPRSEGGCDAEVATVEFHCSPPLGLVGAPDVDAIEGPVHAEREAEGRHRSGVVKVQQGMRPVPR